MPQKAAKPDRRYFQVVITYNNGEVHTAHLIFKNRMKAERYAAHLNTPLVKKVSVKEIPLPRLGRRLKA